ncbi:FG-GAP repeat domain-containing protein, partial [Thermodesulfobacteriota bacterium]
MRVSAFPIITDHNRSNYSHETAKAQDLTGSGIAIGSADSHSTYAIELADIDGDGWLDVVAGNSGLNRLYLNTAGAFPASGTAIGSDSQTTFGISVTDANGDGWWDVVAGNLSSPNRVYV